MLQHVDDGEDKHRLIYFWNAECNNLTGNNVFRVVNVTAKGAFMRSRVNYLRSIAVVFLLLAALSLSACGKRIPISKYVLNSEDNPNWYSSYKERDGFEYLKVKYYSKGGGSSEPVQIPEYLIFGSSAEARSYYKSIYKEYKDEDADFYGHGSNWFVSDVPRTYDAVITRMYYVDRNVVICADVEVTTYSTLGDVGHTNNSGIEDYIRQHHSEMREFVMELFQE